MSKVEKTLPIHVAVSRVERRPGRTVMSLLDPGNPGFFLSKVRLNRILKNCMGALEKLAQLFQVLANVHPCHLLQKTTGNSSSAYNSLE